MVSIRKNLILAKSICLLGLTATGCNQPTSDLSSDIKNVNGANGVGLLGSGWDTHTESFPGGECVENADSQVYYAGSQQSEIQFSRSLTEQELETMLNVDVSGKLKLPVFSVDAAANFISEAKSTELSESMVFAYTIKGKTAVLRNTKLTTSGQTLADRGEVDKIRASCGDEFVSKIDLGSRLLVGIKFEFLNKEAISNFKGNINVKYMDLFEVEGAAETALNQFSDSINIKIFAFQQGGKPEKLAEILNGSGEGDNRSSFVTCSVDNRADCLSSLQRVLDYMSGNDEFSFKNQISDFSYNPSIPGGAAFLKYHTTSYYSAGHLALYGQPGALLNQAIQDTRRELIRLYEHQEEHKKTAESLLNMRLTADERQKISTVKVSIENNISRILDTATVCYEKPGDCIRKRGNMRLVDFDPADLTHVNNFYDYCDAYNGYGKNIQETVTHIREFLDASDTTCEELYGDLKSIDIIDVSNVEPKISDLRPLRGLEHINILNIENNNVVNLAPLQSFKNLIELKARNNKIGSLVSISELPKLSYLDLAYNNIVNTEPLRGNTSLKTLLLHGNHPSLITAPLQSLGQLDNLIYSKSQRCNQEIDLLVERQLIAAETGENYKKFNFAPIYNRSGEIDSGINTWARCEIVFPVFDPGA